MSPMERTRHGEVTAELAWSGSGSRSEITPAVGRTVHLPPPLLVHDILVINLLKNLSRHNFKCSHITKTK
ncbi:hypothetical protein Hanom_Chr01g00071351 [Helianthus anomalus]